MSRDSLQQGRFSQASYTAAPLAQAMRPACSCWNRW